MIEVRKSEGPPSQAYSPRVALLGLAGRRRAVGCSAVRPGTACRMTRRLLTKANSSACKESE